jgi:aromatic ring-opening dioxygenase catalytic subunit (LigB family)
MQIVGAFACSHAGLIFSHVDKAEPAQKDRVYAGYAEAAERIRELAPDAILIFATDHGRIYPLTNLPQYVIGVSPGAEGIGDSGLPVCNVPINQPLAQDVLEGAVQAGVDLGFSEEMRIDHSFVVPLMLLTPDLDVPIIPIYQNCNRPPLPTLERSHEVGEKLGQAMAAGRPGRVVVVGTGGLSHWVGDEARRDFIKQPAGTRLGHEAEHPLVLGERGNINQEFDHAFLGALADGRLRDFMKDWPADRLDDEAGNGSEEIRNWLMASGTVGDRPARTIVYEPVAEWHTGFAVAEFRVD